MANSHDELTSPSLLLGEPAKSGDVGQRTRYILAGVLSFAPLIFLIICATSAGLTYLLAVTGEPLQGSAQALGWLVWLNGVLLFGLGALVLTSLRRVMRLRKQSGGSSLHLRFAALFCVAAFAPALLVAVLLGAGLNRTLDNWFNGRIAVIVDTMADTARSYLAQENDDIETMALDMANDITRESGLSERAPEVFRRFLTESAAYRGFDGVFIQRSSGEVLHAAFSGTRVEAMPIAMIAKSAADRGETAVYPVFEDETFRGVRTLPTFDEAYLVVVRKAPANLLARLKQADSAKQAFARARERSVTSQSLMILGYVQSAALLVLGAILLGLRAASQVVEPIGQLVAATKRLREGGYGTRVPVGRTRDEVEDLSIAFNDMSERIADQRHALEIARQDAEARRVFMETVLAGVSAGVLQIGADERVALANGAAEMLLGRDITGKKLSEVAPDLSALIMEWEDRAVPLERDLRIGSGPDARQLHVRAALNGQDEAVVLTLDDLTWFVAVQKQAAWRDVARRIAHEIRNPLTPIQLSSERLKRKYLPQITSDRDTFTRLLDTIARQVADIGRLVQSFTAASRTPAPEFAPLELGKLLREVAFAQGLTAQDVQITVEIEPDLPMIAADEGLLGQAITNLIKNSIEAITGKRAAESQHTHERIKVFTRHNSGSIFITIDDTGPGFPSSNRNKLLEPYVTTREKGMGLGLAIALSIITDHNGEITLGDRSDGEQGAQVSITLPTLHDLRSPKTSLSKTSTTADLAELPRQGRVQ